jgi:hypothetical protein
VIKIAPNSNTSRVAMARAPKQDLEIVSLGVHPRTTYHLVESGRLASLGEYYGLIYLTSTLTSPHAIFQGLNRPFLSPGIDDTIYAYLSSPKENYTFLAEDRNAGSGPHRIPVPRESVFVTFVSFAQDVVDDVRQSLDPADRAIDGAVLFWEWTIASQAEPSLPRDHRRRYRRNIWPTPQTF